MLTRRFRDQGLGLEDEGSGFGLEGPGALGSFSSTLMASRE